VVALDAETGAPLWKTYTIEDEPRPTKRNGIGVQLFGPAGAAIWSAPTLDPARGAVYVATGNAYSRPAADTSDAVIALDMKTGHRLWHRQLTPEDAYIVGCTGGRALNCPLSATGDHGPDHDFGQSPILTTLADGRRLLVIAQKSGVVHALDPEREGQILWQVRVGKGGVLGGSQWGSAVDKDKVYVAISDVRFRGGGPLQLDPGAGGGLFGLDLATGRVAWSVPPVPPASVPSAALPSPRP
jgi:polyvinyl alcohol dehydrogenase (cytochrome)